MMQYTDFFRRLRKSRGLTHETLAAKAGCHRNTVLNVERNRPVKIRTVLELLEAMDYPRDSFEAREMAFLWLESASGISFSAEEIEVQTKKIQEENSRRLGRAYDELKTVIRRGMLSSEQVSLLAYAGNNTAVLEIVRQIRDLLEKQQDPTGDVPDENAEGDLRVAEE